MGLCDFDDLLLGWRLLARAIVDYDSLAYHLPVVTEWIQRGGFAPPSPFGGPQPTIILSPTDDPPRAKSRLHLDVNATDRDQDAELARLLALGARPADVGQTGQESWHVLADPEGNEFCVLSRTVAPEPEEFE